MQLLDDYFRIQAEIYQYFGYTEDWKVIPIADSRHHFWCIDERGTEVFFADSEEELRTQEGQSFSNEIFTYVHLNKYVYEGPEYTMIVVDTNTDGNKFLQVFDNTKRRQQLASLEDADGE